MNTYFTEYNKESFKLSIIDTLNLPENEIEGRINEELFESYIVNVLEVELRGMHPNLKLLNPIIVKLSKVKHLYERYARTITKLDHETYIYKLKELLATNLELIYAYAIENIDFIDYNNQIEARILEIYANKIITSKLSHLVEQRWFIKYIIHSKSFESNIRPTVYGYSFSYYLKKKNKNLNFKLYKKHDYFLYRNYPIIDPFNNIIYINLGLFKVLNDSKGFEVGLLYLLNSCFKYLTKSIKRNKEFSITYDLEMYRFIKEEIIYKEDNNFYNRNQNYFDSNIDINEASQKMVYELLSNPLFKALNISKLSQNDYNQYKNTSNYYSVDDYIDKLIYSAPSILKDYPMLQMEYNPNGKRKSIKELIKLKNKKINMFEEQIKEFNSIIIENKDPKIIENIKSKLKVLESGIPGVRECHNNMIYKAIKQYDILSFKGAINDFTNFEIKDMLEAVLQEKEVFIERLHSNRKRIFKPTTFLENDEFLSNEYSIAATIESIIKEKTYN